MKTTLEVKSQLGIHTVYVGDVIVGRFKVERKAYEMASDIRAMNPDGGWQSRFRLPNFRKAVKLFLNSKPTGFTCNEI